MLIYLSQYNPRLQRFAGAGVAFLHFSMEESTVFPEDLRPWAYIGEKSQMFEAPPNPVLHRIKPVPELDRLRN